MTNYRHGQMINLIDEMNSTLLAVEPQRCVLVRHRNGECLRCAAVCTTGAISLGEEGIVVSPEKCIGCGTCASACPTGCLTAANPTDEELFGAVEAALAENEGRVAIACERAFAMASGNRMKRDSCDATAPSFVPGKIAGATSDGRPLVGVVCLGRVDESLLVEATARGARSIQLISGPCESCPHRCGGRPRQGRDAPTGGGGGGAGPGGAAGGASLHFFARCARISRLPRAPNKHDDGPLEAAGDHAGAFG